MISVSETTREYLQSTNYTVKPVVVVLAHMILGGYDEDLSNRVDSVTISASMNDSVMTATVTLFIGQGADSLSPFYSGSTHSTGVQPLCAPGAEIRIAFLIGRGADPGEFVGVFHGRIDSVSASWKDGLVTLECRDDGAWWLNTWLMTPGPYGFDGGQECSEVMNAIMLAAAQGQLGSNAPTLISTNPDPVYIVYPQYPEPGPVLEILRTIAQQAGRDVRYFRSYDSLVYYEPKRTTVTPDMTIASNRYEAITEMTWADPDVRNRIEVYWQNLDSSYDGPVTYEDVTSRNLYGPRPFRVFLSRAENITDATRAAAFAFAAVEDQKNPFATHAISMPLDPRVELNDYHMYVANFREYDQNMQFAVASFRHEYKAASNGGQGVTRTTIGARAQPIAAYRDYRRSTPKTTLVSTSPPPDVYWAPEGSFYAQVDSLD